MPILTAWEWDTMVVCREGEHAGTLSVKLSDTTSVNAMHKLVGCSRLINVNVVSFTGVLPG